PATSNRRGRNLRSYTRQASRAKRLEESRQQGQSGSQEAQGAVGKASTWASEGQQEHPQSRRDLHAGVIAYYQLARRLAATHRRDCLIDLLGAGWPLWQP